MADYVARSSVHLNGQQAEDQLEKLGKRAKELHDQMKKLRQSNDLSGFKKLEKELKEVNKETRQLRKEVFSVEAVLKNLSGASLKEIATAATKAKNELREMKQTDPGFAAKAKELELLNKKMVQLNNLGKEQRSTISRIAQGFNDYFGMATAAVAAFTGIFLGMRKAIDSFNEFEERVSNLSALTGLAGDELKWLSDKANELSTSSLEAGIRVTQSAKDIIDAFTKTGSARPELLKNKEELSGVTQEAIILSNASKTELQPSIEALTMVMNQYNVPASEARRIINSLAAGSKAGAGEIPYLTTAFEKAGTVAADADISIETLVATIETLAPRISQPEIAGRSLKGVILDLQTGADDTNPAIVGLATALENLGKKQLSITELVKMFGSENITAAKILINNVGELKKYEAAVTNTNVAIEQATINTNNNTAKLAQAKNSINLVSKELGEKLSPIYGSIIGKTSMLLKGLTVMVNFFTKYGHAIIIATSAIVGYTIAVKTAAIADTAWIAVKGALTGQITLATIAQRAFNVAVKANPIGLIIGLLAAGITWLITWNNKTGEVTRAFHKWKDSMKDVVDWLMEIYDNSQFVRGMFQGLFAMLKVGFAIIKGSVISFLEPLKFVAKLLKAVLTLDFSGIKEAFVELGKNMANSAKQTGESITNAFLDGSEAVINGRKSKYADKPASNIFGFLGTFDTGLGTYNGPLRPAESSIPEKPKKPQDPDKPKSGYDTPDKTIEENQKKLEDALQKANISEQNILKQQLLDKKLTQEQFNMEMLALEMAHLVAMRELKKQHGQDLTQIDSQILDQELKTQDFGNKQLEEMMRLALEVEKSTAEAEQKVMQDTDKEIADSATDTEKQVEEAGDNIIKSIDERIEAAERLRQIQVENAVFEGESAVENAETVEDAGKAILNSIRKQIMAHIAESIAISMAKALKTVPFPFNIIAATAAGGAASFLMNKLIPKFAEGKYPDMEFAGIPETGMYGSRPQLGIFNEVPGQPEMVVDGITTRRIQLNYPEIMKAIRSVRDGRTPQYAEGKYPAAPSGSPAENKTGIASGISPEDAKALTTAIQEFMRWRPAMSVELFEKKQMQFNQIKDDNKL
jgi:TP901 family phage tail tape measure protein